MKRKVFIASAILFILMAIGVKIVSYDPPAELQDVDKIVEPYHGRQLRGFEDIISSSQNFKLGLNKQGEIIFADRGKAYDQMLITCRDGIEATRKKASLPRISKNNTDAYGGVADQLSYDEARISKQATFIGLFYTIYSHSDVEYYMNNDNASQ